MDDFFNSPWPQYNDSKGIAKVGCGRGGCGFCYPYDDPLTYADIYGAYYNWKAVNTGKICPVGWHVPDDEEWSVLSEYLGGSDFAALKMMVVSKKYWSGVDYVIPTNESGFSALPGGLRSIGGNSSAGYGAFWYSSSNITSTSGSSIGITSYGSYIYYYIPKSYGMNIRCVKD